MSNSKFFNPDLIKAIKNLYMNELTSDVHFIFNSSSGERIPAHKCLLVVNSNVFNAMFSGFWSEKDEVNIVDASPAAFKEFLQFFYYDEVEITMEKVEEVLRLGQQYLVPACVNACTLLLMKNVTNENVCYLYGLSILTDLKDLKKLCEAKISFNSTHIFKTRGFLECDRQALSHILQLESLTCSEISLFKACMEWVSVASKSKILDKPTVLTHLGDSFYAIRFGLIKDELKDCFSSHQIELADDLRLELSHEIDSEHIRPLMFKQRKGDWIKELVVCIREKKHHSYEGTIYDDNQPYEIRCPEITTFSTNAVLLLRAIVCADAYSATYDDDLLCTDFDGIENAEVVLLKIFEGPCEIENVEGYVEQKSGSKRRKMLLESWSSNVIHLKKPIVISPGINYTINLELEGDSADGNLYTDFELKNTEGNVEDGITIKFTNDAELNGTIRNFIHGLHFSQL